MEMTLTLTAADSGLTGIAAKMSEWYDIKMCGIVGPESGDMEKISILRRTVEYDIYVGSSTEPRRRLPKMLPKKWAR